MSAVGVYFLQRKRNGHSAVTIITIFIPDPPRQQYPLPGGMPGGGNLPVDGDQMTTMLYKVKIKRRQAIRVGIGRGQISTLFNQCARYNIQAKIATEAVGWIRAIGGQGVVTVIHQ